MKNKGFTLVELSIVIVIVGLLIGGILVGQSLIESAKINSQIKQIEQYDIAVANFKSKYKCLPADCNKFPFKTSQSTTYIGNGNGMYDGGSAGNLAGNEQIYFFAALSSAQMINEDYTTCTNTVVCAGSAVFAGFIGKKGMWPELKIAPKKAMIIVGDKLGGLYYFLAINASSQSYYGNISSVGVVPAALAAPLDKKMDDGFPSTGDVYATERLPTAKAACDTVPACTHPDPTVMQLDVVNGACTNSGTPRTYNVASTNLCRLVVTSETN